MSAPSFPPTRRIVTGHTAQAKATVVHDSSVQTKHIHGGVYAALLWSSPEFPADVNSSEDRSLLPTGLTNDGSLMRFVDFPPQSVGSIHRSVTLDYILVVKGQIVLTLDDGSRTTLKEGDSVIQQATMHGWDNETDEWTRLLCTLIKSHPPTVNGKELGSEVGFTVGDSER